MKIHHAITIEDGRGREQVRRSQNHRVAGERPNRRRVAVVDAVVVARSGRGAGDTGRERNPVRVPDRRAVILVDEPGVLAVAAQTDVPREVAVVGCASALEAELLTGCRTADGSVKLKKARIRPGLDDLVDVTGETLCLGVRRRCTGVHLDLLLAEETRAGRRDSYRTRD